MKTVAVKDIKTGGFTMCRLTGFGSISSDDRADYTSENKFTEYKNLADGKFGTKVSLGNVKTSLDLKETRIVTLEDDKLVKESKISALEDDKAVKDTKIANLESDKNDKDNRVAALESDKNEKDTKMSDMESDMALLASQVSLGNVRVSLGNLVTRVSSLETLGIKGISNAVSWTNLTDINLSGEKLTNGDFSQLGYVENTSYTFPTSPNGNHNTHYVFESTNRPLVIALKTIDGITEGEVYEMHRYHVGNGKANIQVSTDNMVWVSHRGLNWEVVDKVPTNWTVSGGSLNQTKLAKGIIKGSGSQVAIKQTFSQNIASGIKLIVKVSSDDDIKFTPIKGNGQTDLNNDFTVLGSDGYAEHTTQTNVSGFKVSTVNSLREFNSISIFQGAVSGGTVQAYAGGGLEKISGANGWNAGASSVQKIDGNSDGYVQFQWAKNSLEVGLAYTDDDYVQNIEPYFLRFYSGGRTVASGGYDEASFATAGDWFRIRHYASTNEVKFQKRQTVYSQNPNFVFETASGSNYSYPSASRPKVISLDGSGTLTLGELYEVYTVRASDQALYLRDLDGNAHGYHGQGTRGVRFQVVEEAGQDYVTFQTANTLSNGNDLYIDTSFYNVESRINDVTIVT
jgi:hypothetical protein